MNFKKLYIEKVVYPAMNILQDSRVTRYTKELQATEFMPMDQRMILLRQKLSELLFLCRSQVPIYGSPSVLLWDRPHSPFVLQEEPYMKNRLSLSVCAMTNRTVELTAHEIDNFQPEYITGSVTALELMADAMLKTGIRLASTPKVVTITKGLADEDSRKRLEDAFQCSVAQVLSGRVEGLMAYMCPEGHLHITSEHCYVELLDPKTWTPVSAGQKGLVTVTNLLDETMPHLRVILDYMAVMSEEPCPCGRTLPVLEQVQKVTPA